VETIFFEAGNINPYNVKQPCQVQPLCYDLSSIGEYLNLPAVRQKLGVGNRQWSTCNGAVYGPLESDWIHSFRFDLPFLLKDYRVVIYEGVDDLMCNFYGTSAYLDSMKWSGQNQFIHAKNTTWTIGGKPVGNSRTSGNLVYVNVYDAGHMVPHDQPKAAF